MNERVKKLILKILKKYYEKNDEFKSYLFSVEKFNKQVKLGSDKIFRCLDELQSENKIIYTKVDDNRTLIHLVKIKNEIGITI